MGNQKKIMTQAEARQIIRNFTGDTVEDAYLYTETLRSIANALPDKQEAINFMLKVRRNINTENLIFGANYKRVKRAALKVQRELEADLSLF